MKLIAINFLIKNLRSHFFPLACILFGIHLPDQGSRSSLDGSVKILLRISLAVMFVVVGGYLISSFGEFARSAYDDFVDGWNSVAQPETVVANRIDWKMSRQLLYGLLVLTWFTLQNYFLKRAISITIERHDAERERANQLEIASTLRLLKAQIEPHFLFNTLGVVQHLAEPSAPQAAALTADLITFLRATLLSLRAETIELQDDCTTCGAYLKIMQTRLPRRLTYDIDCPVELQRFHIPTALLLTLVENAIKHGIEPAVDGGHIRIVARRIEAQVVISVSDTGLGFGETIGQGLGLENIRDRLSLMYVGSARLELEENQPRGIVARLVLPA